ncbi:MAG: NAD(P)H-dependent oxidoreductase [Actinomycetota bacterium]|nr:NAD(P)H-dependent oxidoreductase [Actinomycetota bacterium]
MRVLVIDAHPAASTLGERIRREVVDGLTGADHEPTVLELDRLGFRVAMSAEERRRYETDAPIVDPMVAEHAELLRTSRALVVSAPTTIYGLPPLAKGWLERVLVTGVAFSFDPHTNALRPELGHLRWLVGVVTTDAPRWRLRLLGDPARRTITRTLWLTCERKPQRRWHCLANASAASSEDVELFARGAGTVVGDLR